HHRGGHAAGAGARDVDAGPLRVAGRRDGGRQRQRLQHVVGARERRAHASYAAASASGGAHVGRGGAALRVAARRALARRARVGDEPPHRRPGGVRHRLVRARLYAAQGEDAVGPRHRSHPGRRTADARLGGGDGRPRTARVGVVRRPARVADPALHRDRAVPQRRIRARRNPRGPGRARGRDRQDPSRRLGDGPRSRVALVGPDGRGRVLVHGRRRRARGGVPRLELHGAGRHRRTSVGARVLPRFARVSPGAHVGPRLGRGALMALPPPDYQPPRWLEWVRDRIWVISFVLGAIALTLLYPLTRHVPEMPEVMFELPTETWGELVDHREQPFTPAAMAGKVWVAGFVFTRCPSTCPAVTRAMKELRDRFDRTGVEVELVSFSVDPEHDTTRVLADYAASVDAEHPRGRFVTGPRADLEALIGDGFKLGVGDRKELSNGMFDIAHSTKL